MAKVGVRHLGRDRKNDILGFFVGFFELILNLRNVAKMGVRHFHLDLGRDRKCFRERSKHISMSSKRRRRLRSERGRSERGTRGERDPDFAT